jgi:hypothetical protein
MALTWRLCALISLGGRFGGPRGVERAAEGQDEDSEGGEGGAGWSSLALEGLELGAKLGH